MTADPRAHMVYEWTGTEWRHHSTMEHPKDRDDVLALLTKAGKKSITTRTGEPAPTAAP